MLLEDSARLRAQNESYTLKQKLLNAVAQFVRGPIQVFLYAGEKAFAGMGTSIGFLGVSALTNQLQFSADKDRLVNIYRDELALMLGKPRGDLTRSDLEVIRGTNTPIGKDYDILCKNNRAMQIKSLIKNVAISACAVGLAVLGPGLLGSIGVTGMIGYTIIGGLSIVADLLTETTLSRWQGKQSTPSMAFVNQLNVEISKGPVSPTKLFEYSVQVHPQLKQAVEQHFKADYPTLSYKQKQQAIDMLGQNEMLVRIADDVNHGRIRTSEVPFLLSGQNSPSTHINTYRIVKAVPETSREQAREAALSAPDTSVMQASAQGLIADTGTERTIH